MSTLTEEQKRRIEENRKKALERRKTSPNKTPIFPQQASPVQQRTQADIEANKRRALEKLHAKKALARSSNAVIDKIHPVRTSPTKSNELVQNYVQNVMKPPDSRPYPPTRVNLFNTDGGDQKRLPTKSSTIKNGASPVGNEQQKAATFFGQKGTSLTATCLLVDRNSFKVSCDYCTPLIDVFKTINTRSYDAITKDWSFKLEDYEAFMSKASQLQNVVTVSPLPKAILSVFRRHLKGHYPERTIPIANLSRIADQNMVDALMPFQQDGVSYGISKNGRFLLADDMGLGKSIQAICLAAYYRNDWPLLVVCPSSLRFAWKEHFCRWLQSISPEEIAVCVTGRDPCDRLINIVSYDLMARKSQELLKLQFNVVIVDESHLLKSGKTARTRAALPILKQSRRVFLLSGTPALSRPNELYTQIQAVDPRLFSNFQDFGVRYCNGKQMPWGWDFSGSSNLSELQILLEESIMIRRLKCDVIKQLPPKRREMVVLDPEAISKKDREFKSAEKTLGGMLKGAERHGALLCYFQQTSKIKVNAVKNYVLDLLEAGKKFLVFAHHSIMLDALQAAVENKYDYIRIDGRVHTETRKLLCDRFQSRDDVKVAILSITAASTGLNLTAASLVVFAELFWNPGILTQAEDRVHRIGQEDSVVINYLVATNTADDYIWPLIQSKLDVLGKAGLSKDNFSEANTVIAAPKQRLQTGILDYFKQHCDDVLTENGVVSGEEVKGRTDVTSGTSAVGNDEVSDLDWGDDDDDSMLEAVEAVESKTAEIREIHDADFNGENSGQSSTNIRVAAKSGLWNMAAQNLEKVKPKVSESDNFISKVGVNSVDEPFDWLDSIDDELSDVILAGGPELKRRKVDV